MHHFCIMVPEKSKFVSSKKSCYNSPFPNAILLSSHRPYSSLHFISYADSQISVINHFPFDQIINTWYRSDSATDTFQNRMFQLFAHCKFLPVADEFYIRESFPHIQIFIIIQKEKNMPMSKSSCLCHPRIHKPKIFPQAVSAYPQSGKRRSYRSWIGILKRQNQ